MPDTTVGYTTVEELARTLNITSPTDDQTAALVRVLTTSLVEITAEIDRAEDAEPLTEDQEALAAEVQIERSVEHWRQKDSPFGIVGVGVDSIPTYAGKDSWDRHARKLVPLKDQYGLA